MELSLLGGTGVEVSAPAYGTMSFGRNTDETAAAALYRQALEAGINLFDCADVNERGKSEEILGRLIAHERDDILLTTKAYFPMWTNANARGAPRRNLVRALAASLRRLGADRVDVFYVHRFHYGAR